MEHRLHPRERAACQATISYPPLGFVLGRIRDVSVDGMSIDTTPITLNANTPVKVTIKLHTKGRQRLSRFNAVVVWGEKGRAGLMLTSTDEATSGALQELGEALRQAS